MTASPPALHQIRLTAGLLGTLLLAGCGVQPVPASVVTPAGPETVITIRQPGTASDAELEARYGGTLIVRTPTFALLGVSGEVRPTTMQALSGGRGRAERNRGVMRTTEGQGHANGTVGLWGNGTVGLWGSGTVGLWGSGTVGLWGSGTVGLWGSGTVIFWGNGVFNALPQNTAPWTQIGLEAAQNKATRLGLGATVAVLDTGIDLAHPIFAGALSAPNTWHDFVSDDDVPAEDGALDVGLKGHGTEVAGIVRQIAPNAKIMPLRVLNAMGSGDVDDVASAIVWATDHGADVINLSLGTASEVTAISAAVEYANAAGVMVVGAAGNSGQRGVDSPAAQFGGSALNVSVGSASAADLKSVFSRYGAQLDVLAPGEQIYGPAPENRAAAWSGTSMSAPVVAGALALGRGEGFAGSKTVSALRAGALSVDALSGNSAYRTELGRGRVDLNRFVQELMSPNN